MSDTETPAEPFSAAATMTPAIVETTAADPYAAANVPEPAVEAEPAGAPAYVTTVDVEAMFDRLKTWVRKEVDLSNSGLDNSDRETQNP